MFIAFIAEDPQPGSGLIPAAKPTKIPGMDGMVSTLFGYGLWIVVLAGVCATGWGVVKLATAEKNRHGGGSEPFKWMGSGVAAILLAGSLISILNGIAG
ncbi:hypothetical protein [Streptomyces rubellomurinus]|uniref:Uncharacterized protein n=1 Tax=Streptomyces rubellomurinus (strain ATCC 31215) TaxID=359131 RepID=A0A0F2TI76_STRR3|nr:hypothetical protein [Streptomyces rubellomurinus]KJS61960.1 hypothetical protein VM95_11420 [Streptomyces rubellomurinus]